MRKYIAALFLLAAFVYLLAALGSLVPSPTAKPPQEFAGGDFIRPKDTFRQGVVRWERRDRVIRSLDDLDEDLRALSAVRRGLNR